MSNGSFLFGCDAGSPGASRESPQKQIPSINGSKNCLDYFNPNKNIRECAIMFDCGCHFNHLPLFMEKEKYYIVTENKELGPYDFSQIVNLWSQNKIQNTDKIRSADNNTLRDILELLPMLEKAIFSNGRWKMICCSFAIFVIFFLAGSFKYTGWASEIITAALEYAIMGTIFVCVFSAIIAAIIGGIMKAAGRIFFATFAKFYGAIGVAISIVILIGSVK